MVFGDFWKQYFVFVFGRKKVFVTLCNESSYISDTYTSNTSSDSSDSGDCRKWSDRKDIIDNGNSSGFSDISVNIESGVRLAGLVPIDCLGQQGKLCLRWPHTWGRR